MSRRGKFYFSLVFMTVFGLVTVLAVNLLPLTSWPVFLVFGGLFCFGVFLTLRSLEKISHGSGVTRRRTPRDL